MAPTATNLCLHYLRTAGERPRRLALSPASLEALVARERAAGRAPASLADYAREGHAPGADRFTLSFDDAHRSVLEVAAPLLAKLGVPGTLFVPTAYVGTSDEFLDWDGLRALRDAGWSIGSHTATHPRMSWRLYDETGERYAARLYDECARSREALERALGTSVSLFAYPFGECPPEAREAVARAGYAAAFTVAGVAWDGDALRVPRADGMEAHGFIAPSSDEPTRFSVVVPACDRVEILREVVARLGAQSYPRDRHEVLVVDDGSREDLREALRDAASTVRVIAGAGEPGVFRAGRARQRGADEARFETVAFLDADVVVGRDYLWHLDWAHRRAPRAAVLGYLSGYNLHDMGWIHTLAQARAARDVERDLPVIPDRSREPTLRACLDNLDWLEEPWRLSYTGNLSVPRALLADAGGFADEFTGWGLEDLDLGLRLHAAGATWVFSRFAVGYHLVDPDEGPPRNPFRIDSPRREHFAGYLRNLETLARRYAGDPRVEAFRTQTLRDIEETCGRPDTVGVEMGGACSLDCAFHRAMERCQPGGLDPREVLDRVAYARKVGARALYLLGGEPGEHPGLLPALADARAAGIRRVTAQTSAVPFADEALARAAAAAGLNHAVVKVFAFDREIYEATTRTPGSYTRFLAGIEHLRAAGIRLTALLVATNDTLARLPDTLAELERRAIPLDEAVATDASVLPALTSSLAAWAARRGLSAPPARALGA